MVEANRFDSLTKRLATRASRRSTLRGLAGAALAAAGWAKSTSASPRGMVTICHWDDELGVYQQLSINQNALGSHRNHGDFILPKNGTCNDCNTICTATAGTCGIGTCSESGECSYEPNDSLCPGDCEACALTNQGRYDCVPLEYGADCGTCRICDGAGACINAPNETNLNVSCTGSGEYCCNGACTNTGVDELNCGPCGTVCISGWICCFGTCRNPGIDNEHCGDCSINCLELEQTCGGGVPGVPGVCGSGT